MWDGILENYSSSKTWKKQTKSLIMCSLKDKKIINLIRRINEP